MNMQQAQQLIREASPLYLAANPPIGIAATLAALSAQNAPQKKFVEFRQPFCRKPDELDQLQSCYVCGGDGTDNASDEDCHMCGGERTLPFQENELFLTVYRDGHSIETLAVVLDNGEVNAFVSLSQPGFPEGKRVLLTDHEAQVARDFLGKPEPDVSALSATRQMALPETSTNLSGAGKDQSPAVVESEALSGLQHTVKPDRREPNGSGWLNGDSNTPPAQKLPEKV